MYWVFVCILVVALFTGFNDIKYYGQAIYGQLSLQYRARPIDAYLADPRIDVRLKERLLKVKQIREFAIRELGLPDNGSYREYVEIAQPYVAWNVVVTPELSIEPLKWCFPVAGCVSYRGYFRKGDALAFASAMRRAGYDAHIIQVPAYSTLGWFRDPVLSTFIYYPDVELARLIFHELAHQRLYSDGDPEFNESFAVAVEEEGVRRWLAAFGDDVQRERQTQYEIRKNDFLALIAKYRQRLALNYASQASATEKRARKKLILEALQNEFQTIRVRWNGYAGYDRWFAQTLNNAHFASITTYRHFVPGFRTLLQKEADLPAFYAAARSMTILPQATRHARLTQLGRPATQPTPANYPAGPRAQSVWPPAPITARR